MGFLEGVVVGALAMAVFIAGCELYRFWRLHGR